MEPPPARGSGSLAKPTRRLVYSVTEYNHQGNLSNCIQTRWKARAEGRRQERIEFIVPVLIVSHGATEDQYAEGLSIDLSESGVAFEAEADLTPGDLVDLVFEVNADTVYRRFARILYR